MVNSSEGGLDEPSLDLIKFLAPKLFSAQGRAVTKNDIKNHELKWHTFRFKTVVRNNMFSFIPKTPIILRNWLCKWYSNDNK